jgi:hypothetical protein
MHIRAQLLAEQMEKEKENEKEKLNGPEEGVNNEEPT